MYYFFYKPNHFNTMNVDEVKQDIKNKIAEINRSFPKYWSKTFNKEIREDKIPILQYHLVRTSSTFKFHKVSLIILLVITAGLSVCSYTIKVYELFMGYNLSNNFNVRFFSDLNNFYLLGVFTIIWAITTFRSYRIKENLIKKIFFLQMMDKMDL